MAKIVMERSAADNKYLHKDFHIAFDQGIESLGMKYGDNAVRDFLYNTAKEYLAPLIEDARENGLNALKTHIENTYEIEEMPEAVKCTLTDNELIVKVTHCPAVAYMKKAGRNPSCWYKYSTITVNEAIANELDLGFEMIKYDETDGKASYRFFRR